MLNPLMHAALAPTPKAASLAVAHLLSQCETAGNRANLLRGMDADGRSAAMHAVLAGNVGAGVLNQLMGEHHPDRIRLATQICSTASRLDGNRLFHLLAADGSQDSIAMVVSLFYLLDCHTSHGGSLLMQENKAGESPLLVAVKV